MQDVANTWAARCPRDQSKISLSNYPIEARMREVRKKRLTNRTFNIEQSPDQETIDFNMNYSLDDDLLNTLPSPTVNHSTLRNCNSHVIQQGEKTEIDVYWMVKPKLAKQSTYAVIPTATQVLPKDLYVYQYKKSQIHPILVDTGFIIEVRTPKPSCTSGMNTSK